LEQRLSSSALGDNDLSYLSMPGRLLFDTMNLVKRDHKLDSYTLTVASTSSATPRTSSIFRLHAGDDDDRAVVAKYCAQTAPSAACSAKLCAVTGAFGMGGLQGAHPGSSCVARAPRR
jgi:DNA polymerase delta subunit 1